jgi:hypothetical protein
VRIKIHPLLVFFSIMGGLKLFGLNGLILGPMMLMLFFTGVDLFDQAYGTRKPGSDPASDIESTGGKTGSAENLPEAPPAISSEDHKTDHEAAGP